MMRFLLVSVCRSMFMYYPNTYVQTSIICVGTINLQQKNKLKQHSFCLFIIHQRGGLFYIPCRYMFNPNIINDSMIALRKVFFLN